MTEPLRLKPIFDKLESNSCEYSMNVPYTEILDGKGLIEVVCLETIEFKRDYPKELILFNYLGKDKQTNVIYACEDAGFMKRTLEQLRLPNSWPTNLGEKVFCKFQDRVEGKTGPLYIKQEVIPNYEHQFELILKKLAHIFNGGAIDSEFYKNAHKPRKLKLSQCALF